MFYYYFAEELERSKLSLLEERERFKDRVGRLQQQQQQLLEEHEEQQRQRQQEQQRRTAWSQSPSKANHNRTDTNKIPLRASSDNDNVTSTMRMLSSQNSEPYANEYGRNRSEQFRYNNTYEEEEEEEVEYNDENYDEDNMAPVDDENEEEMGDNALMAVRGMLERMKMIK